MNENQISAIGSRTAAVIVRSDGWVRNAVPVMATLEIDTAAMKRRLSPCSLTAFAITRIQSVSSVKLLIGTPGAQSRNDARPQTSPFST